MSRCQNEFIFEDSDQVGEYGSSSPFSSGAGSFWAVGFCSPAQSEGSPRGGSEPQGSPVHSTFQTRPFTHLDRPCIPFCRNFALRKGLWGHHYLFLWEVCGLGRWAERCCNEVVRVLVNDITGVLIWTVAISWILVHVNFRFTNPEWICSFGLMSQDPTISNRTVKDCQDLYDPIISTTLVLLHQTPFLKYTFYSEGSSVTIKPLILVIGHVHCCIFS